MEQYADLEHKRKSILPVIDLFQLGQVEAMFRRDDTGYFSRDTEALRDSLGFMREVFSHEPALGRTSLDRAIAWIETGASKKVPLAEDTSSYTDTSSGMRFFREATEKNKELKQIENQRQTLRKFQLDVDAAKEFAAGVDVLSEAFGDSPDVFLKCVYQYTSLQKTLPEQERERGRRILLGAHKQFEVKITTQLMAALHTELWPHMNEDHATAVEKANLMRDQFEAFQIVFAQTSLQPQVISWLKAHDLGARMLPVAEHGTFYMRFAQLALSLLKLKEQAGLIDTPLSWSSDNAVIEWLQAQLASDSTQQQAQTLALCEELLEA